MIRLERATRGRLDAVRKTGRGESGYALLLVMFVTVLVLIGTASMLTVTISNIAPARHSQDSDAATAAAEAGIQDYVAHLNAYCLSYSIQTCPWLTSQQSTAITATIGTESYSAAAQSWHDYLTANGGTLRITSTGTSPTGTTKQVSKTLVADISSTPSPLSFNYFSDYETLGKTFLDNYYGARTITISDSTEADAAGVPSGTKVVWSGTGLTSAGYSDDVCEKLYYDDASNAGTLGRYTVEQNRPSLDSGTDFAENGSTATPTQQLVGASTAVTRYAPCEVTFSKGMTFTGPVYSHDALYLSNGEWGSTSGPAFHLPAAETRFPAASTAWQTTSSPAAPSATGAYRSYPLVGGQPAEGLVKSSPFDLSLPTAASPTATCTYTGPTRITLSGSTATVSSPLTAAGAGACYTSTGSGTGVVSAKVPVDITTINVQNAATGQAASLSFPGLTVGANNDVTSYSQSKGDIYLEGTLSSGRLSLVSSDDVIVTGDVKATHTSAVDSYGEPGWKSGAAIDIVGTNNVRIYHPVKCKSGSASGSWCPNDITGLYTTTQASAVVNDDGSLKNAHPALQYCNLISGSADCSNDQTSTTTIEAAVFALNGSLYADNYDRGRAMGTLQITGGLYENHRGATGKQWEIPTSSSTRHNSGYKMQITYLNYQTAGLGYVPSLRTGNPNNPWQVVSVSTKGSS